MRVEGKGNKGIIGLEKLAYPPSWRVLETSWYINLYIYTIIYIYIKYNCLNLFPPEFLKLT